MSAKWIKLGSLVEVGKNPDIPWLSGGSGPCCAVQNKRDKSVIDLYISGRDTKNRSLIGLAQYSIKLNKIINIYREPVLKLGGMGMFDENGTSYPSIIIEDSKTMMYYTGWIKGVHVPWYNNLGLAVSVDGFNFKRFARSPIMQLSDSDPIGIGSSFVLKDDGFYHLWYTRFDRWGSAIDSHRHYYNIKHATSSDGISFISDSEICIDFQNKNEYAISKPCVLKIDEYFVMWYSYRGSLYRPGLAKSKDGINWTRIDYNVGIDVSKKDFDNQMLCYPYVIDAGNYFFMFYSGNNYGKDGLGVAKISKEKMLEMIHV